MEGWDARSMILWKFRHYSCTNIDIDKFKRAYRDRLTFMACANIGLAKKNATSECIWLSWSIEWIEGNRLTYSSTVIVDPKNVPNCTSVSWHWSYSLPVVKVIVRKQHFYEGTRARKYHYLDFAVLHIYQQAWDETCRFLYKRRNAFVEPLIDIKQLRDHVQREHLSNALRISSYCELGWSNRP